MLAHGGYNLISFFSAVMPLLDRAKIYVTKTMTGAAFHVPGFNQRKYNKDNYTVCAAYDGGKSAAAVL